MEVYMNISTLNIESADNMNCLLKIEHEVVKALCFAWRWFKKLK